MYKRIRDLEDPEKYSSQRIYSNYECGDVDIPTQILIKLAEFHNTSKR